MDFSYSTDQEEFRRELRNWLEENLPQGWLGGDHSTPDAFDSREAFLRNWQRTLADGDWAGIHWPKEYGGRGASLIEQTIYEQEMARVDAPHRINLVGIDMVGPTLMEIGTEAQKERFIPKILDATEVWCQGFSEPHAGSDVAALTTRAEDRGDHFVIDGQKIWTSRARDADWCFLFTRTDGSGTKHEGLTAVMVGMDQPAIETDPIHQITDETEFSQTFFDGATASKEHVVGEVDEGWDVVLTQLAFDHGYTEIYEDAQFFEDLVAFCGERTRSGEPLSEDPVVRQRLAELDTRIEAAKLTHMRNVHKHMESGSPPEEASMDRAVGDDIQNDLKSFAVAQLGPEATLWEDGHAEGEWTQDYLFSFGKWIAGGTGDIQRNIIAETVLGLPSDPKSRTSHRGGEEPTEAADE